MGALGSMRPYCDEMAMNITLGYVYELSKIHNRLPVGAEGAIDINSEVDIDEGCIKYTLKGYLGDQINNPVVKIGIIPDLLRGLRRGEKAYNRHILNIPRDDEILPLVKEKYNTMRLIGIGNDYKDEPSGCRVIHSIDKVKNMLREEGRA